MKLTDKEVTEHLKENYYIGRSSWKKDTGIYWDHGFIFKCGPFENRCSFSLDDLIADDWILYSKE